MVICLERGADLHTTQLMPLPLTVSCFSKIQIGFTSLVPAHLGSPGQRAVKRVYVIEQLMSSVVGHCWCTTNNRNGPENDHNVPVVGIGPFSDACQPELNSTFIN